MQLVGLLDSPFVRRVAISMDLLGIAFERRPLSVFSDYAEFYKVTPLVKAPSLICDDGEIITESNVILDYLEGLAGLEASLVPRRPSDRQRNYQLVGIALTACEKAGQSLYERSLRPPEKQHQPWLDRVESQLDGALLLLEAAARNADPWLIGDGMTQAHVSVAVTWRFLQHVSSAGVQVPECPALTALSARAEELPSFRRYSFHEGVTATLN